MDNYSLSDLKAITDNDCCLGGSGGLGFLILILLFFMIGGNGFGYGRQNEFGQYATAASQNEILLGQKFDALSRQINQVGDGLCSSTYALNNSILGEGRALQTQIANCCCENQRNVDSVRFDMANYANAINSNIDAKFAALEKSQLEQTISSQQNQINQLALAQQMAGVVKYPMSSAYAMLNNPFCACGNSCNSCCN